jgi:hypothetical protein
LELLYGITQYASLAWWMRGGLDDSVALTASRNPESEQLPCISIRFAQCRGLDALNGCPLGNPACKQLAEER